MTRRISALFLLSGLCCAAGAGCGAPGDEYRRPLNAADATGATVPAGVPTIAAIGGAPDDYLGLLLLSNHPNVDLQAVSVSAGPSDPHRAGVAVRRLFRFCEKYDVPVGIGRSSLPGPFPTGQYDRDSELDRHPVLSNIRRGTPCRLTGEQLITTAIREAKTPVAVIGMGPLTHLRAAAAAAPDLLTHVRGVYLSAGDAANFPPAAKPAEDPGEPGSEAADTRQLGDLEKKAPKPAVRAVVKPDGALVLKPEKPDADDEADTRTLGDLDKAQKAKAAKAAAQAAAQAAKAAAKPGDGDKPAEPADADPEAKDAKPEAKDGKADAKVADGKDECNIAADEFAAKAVLEWPVPVYVIPTDVIRKVSLDAAFLAELDQTNPTPCGQAASAMLARYRESAIAGKPASMGNALAVLAFLQPELFTWEARQMTVADGKLVARPPGAAGRTVMVAVNCDAAKVRRAAFEVLARKAAGSDAPPPVIWKQ